MAPDRIVLNSTGTHYFLAHEEVSEEAYRAAHPLQEFDYGATAETFAGTASGWPIHSEALAYHPHQKAEAEAHLAKLGVPTEVDPKGRPVLRDRAHRKAVLKALKMIDRNSFTGY